MQKNPLKRLRKFSPKGIFLSNGPGDPEPVTYAIENIKKFLKEGSSYFWNMFRTSTISIGWRRKNI